MDPSAQLHGARPASWKALSANLSPRDALARFPALHGPHLCSSLIARPVMRSRPPSTPGTSTKSSSSPWWPHSSWALESSSCCSGSASTYELPRVRAVTGWDAGETSPHPHQGPRARVPPWLMETDWAERTGTPDTWASFPVPWWESEPSRTCVRSEVSTLSDLGLVLECTALGCGRRLHVVPPLCSYTSCTVAGKPSASGQAVGQGPGLAARSSILVSFSVLSHREKFLLVFGHLVEGLCEGR